MIHRAAQGCWKPASAIVEAVVEYRTLGSTGLRVSELCLGTMQFGWTADEATSHAVLDAAFEAGVTFVDTADIYSRWAPGNPGGVAETIIGRWMSLRPGRRAQIILATKVRGPMGDRPEDAGLSRAHILTAVEASLRRLGTDCIDLYQTHWPDDDTPIDETLEALDSLVRRGLVRYLGCSNYPAWRLMQTLWESDRLHLTRFECLQPHYNLVHRDEYERELESVCQTYALGVIPYSPLAGGYLTGKYAKEAEPPAGSRGSSSARIQGYIRSEHGPRVVAALESLAAARGCSHSQVALAWLLSRPGVTSPIIGPRSLGQLVDNLGAAGVRLQPEERKLLDEASAWKSDSS
jgi:aryl-alcohol dehydrogenase-like predicted oxidoreductase